MKIIRKTIGILSLVSAASLLSACAGISAISAARSIAGAVLEASGISKKDSDIRKTTKQYKMNIYAGDRLNTTKEGKSLSLVTKIYILRSSEKLATLTAEQFVSEESEKAALGEDLVSTRELTLIPGKAYEIPLVVPGDAVAIGVIGLFRAPYTTRWRLAFDLTDAPTAEAFTVGAHACALTASKGALINEISPESARSLVGVQCNS